MCFSDICKDSRGLTCTSRNENINLEVKIMSLEAGLSS